MGVLKKYANSVAVEQALDDGKAAYTGLGGHTVKSDVPENAIFTDTVYDDAEIKERVEKNETKILT